VIFVVNAVKKVAWISKQAKNNRPKPVILNCTQYHFEGVLALLERQHIGHFFSQNM
jgi:hypothetical protein